MPRPLGSGSGAAVVWDYSVPVSTTPSGDSPSLETFSPILSSHKVKPKIQSALEELNLPHLKELNNVFFFSAKGVMISTLIP